MTRLRTKIKQSKFGSGDDYAEFEDDGTLVLVGDATVWDDLRFPAFGRNMDVANGRIDFDYANVGINFQYNSRYNANDQLTIIAQMPHAKKMDSDIYVHMHWAQVKDYIPNILLEYRWYKNGDDISGLSWTQLNSDDDLTQTFSYSSGTLAQISGFTAISPPANETVSSILEMKIFRDTDNDSSVFDGSCPYNTGGNTSWLLKELDIHYEIDTLGSREEYAK